MGENCDHGESDAGHGIDVTTRSGGGQWESRSGVSSWATGSPACDSFVVLRRIETATGQGSIAERRLGKSWVDVVSRLVWPKWFSKSFMIKRTNAFH